MGAQHLEAATWGGEARAASPLDDDVAAVLGIDPRAFQVSAPTSRALPRRAPRPLARTVWIPLALALTAGASALLVLGPGRRSANSPTPHATAPDAAQAPMAQMLVDAAPPRPVYPAAPPQALPPSPAASNAAGAEPPRAAPAHRSRRVELASRTLRERRHTPGPADRAWSPHVHFAGEADAPYSPGRPFPSAPSLRPGARDAEVADLGRGVSARRSLIITPDGGRGRTETLHGPGSDSLTRLQSPEVVRSVRIDAVDAIRLLRQK